MTETTNSTFNPTSAGGYTEAKDPIIFDEQCYLMLFWKDFVDYSKAFSLCSMESTENRSKNKFFDFRPKNLTLLDSEYPELIPSLFRKKKYSFDFFRMLTPNIQALLVPKIRIYKLIPSQSKNLSGNPTEFDEMEMLFPNIESPLRSTNKIKTNISGVGIKSFSYELEGGLPNTVELFIKCKLSMVFSSIDGFFKKRTFPNSKRDYSYSDLITAHEVQGGKLDNWSPIKIEIGWAKPSREAIKNVLRASNIEGKNINRMINTIVGGIDDSSTSLIVNHYGHDFNIKKDGKIDLTINFMGATEKAWASKQFDLIEPRPSEDKIGREVKNQVSHSNKLLKFAEIINTAAQRSTPAEVSKCIDAVVAVKEPSKQVTRAQACDTHGKTVIPSSLFEGGVSPFPKNDRQWWEQNFSLHGADLVDISIGSAIASVVGGEQSKKIYKTYKNNTSGFLDKKMESGKKAVGADNLNDKRMENQKKLITYRLNNRKINPAVLQEAHNKMRGELITAEEIKDSPEMALEVARAQLQIKAYRRIMNLLYNSGRVHFVDVTQEDVQDWRARIHGINDVITKEEKRKKVEKKAVTPPAVVMSVPESSGESPATGNFGSSRDGCRTEMTAYPSKVTNIYNIKRCLESDDQDSFMKVAKQKTISLRRINFIYFSDIIDAAIEAISIGKDDRTTTNIQSRSAVTIGNLLLKDFQSLNSNYSVNVGHLPVSVHDYMVWFQKKVVDRQTKVWSLMNFVRDAFGDLIFTSLGEGCSTKIRQPSRPAFAVMESIGVQDVITRCGKKKFRDVIPRLPVVCLDKIRIENIKNQKKGRAVWDGGAGPYLKNRRLAGLLATPQAPSMYQPHQQAKNVFTYFYFFGEPIDIGGWTGNRRSDEKLGVFHFDLAAASGIVKSIDFKKVAFQALRAQRIVEASEHLGIGGQLLDQYDADIKLYGTHYFKPGIMIYIEDSLPNSFGEKNPNMKGIIGIGGYYIITNVSHEISAGKNETTIKAVWQGYVGTDYNNNKLIGKRGSFHTCSTKPNEYYFSSGAKNLCRGRASPFNYVKSAQAGCLHGIEQDSDVPFPAISRSQSVRQSKAEQTRTSPKVKTKTPKRKKD